MFSKMNSWRCLLITTVAAFVLLKSGSAHFICNETVDIIFVVDDSPLLLEEPFEEHIPKLLKSFINHFNVEDGPERTRVGVVTYSNSPSLVFHLNRFRSLDEMEARIDEDVVWKTGYCRASKALEYVANVMVSIDNGWRPNIQTFVVLITNGQFESLEKTKTASDRLKTLGVKIISVLVGSSGDEVAMKDVSSNPQKYYSSFGNDFTDMGVVGERFVKEICQAVTPTCGRKPLDVVFLFTDNESVNNSDTIEKIIDDFNSQTSGYIETKSRMVNQAPPITDLLENLTVDKFQLDDTSTDRKIVILFVEKQDLLILDDIVEDIQTLKSEEVEVLVMDRWLNRVLQIQPDFGVPDNNVIRGVSSLVVEDLVSQLIERICDPDFYST